MSTPGSITAQEVLYGPYFWVLLLVPTLLTRWLEIDFEEEGTLENPDLRNMVVGMVVQIGYNKVRGYGT